MKKTRIIHLDSYFFGLSWGILFTTLWISIVEKHLDGILFFIGDVFIFSGWFFMLIFLIWWIIVKRRAKNE